MGYIFLHPNSMQVRSEQKHEPSRGSWGPVWRLLAYSQRSHFPSLLQMSRLHVSNVRDYEGCWRGRRPAYYSPQAVGPPWISENNAVACFASNSWFSRSHWCIYFYLLTKFRKKGSSRGSGFELWCLVGSAEQMLQCLLEFHSKNIHHAEVDKVLFLSRHF